MFSKILKGGLTLVFLFTCVFAQAQGLKKGDTEEDKTFGLVLPEKKPNIAKEVIESYMKQNTYKELFDLHEEVVGYYRELSTLKMPLEDPKAQKKADKEIPRLEKKLNKAKRDLFRAAKKIRQPMDKEYDKLQSKYDELNKKAEEAAEKNNDKQMMKFSQEAQKFTGRLEQLKKGIDVVNVVLFFDEFEDKKDTPGILGDNDPEDKKAKKSSKDGKKRKKKQ